MDRKTSWQGRITDADGTVRVFDDPKEFAEASGVFSYSEIDGYGLLSQSECEAEGFDPVRYAENWAAIRARFQQDKPDA